VSAALLSRFYCLLILFAENSGFVSGYRFYFYCLLKNSGFVSGYRFSPCGKKLTNARITVEERPFRAA
jgi:hypothetical protein